MIKSHLSPFVWSASQSAKWRSQSFYCRIDTKTNLMYKIYFSPHTHTLTELPNFFLVGIHTKPYDAFSEINALSKVYDEAVSYFKTESGIILGDFNADCRYLSMASYCDLSLVTDRRFTWSLHPMDTTTTSTICAYDRYL